MTEVSYTACSFFFMHDPICAPFIDFYSSSFFQHILLQLLLIAESRRRSSWGSSSDWVVPAHRHAFMRRSGVSSKTADRAFGRERHDDVWEKRTLQLLTPVPTVQFFYRLVGISFFLHNWSVRICFVMGLSLWLKVFWTQTQMPLAAAMSINIYYH